MSHIQSNEELFHEAYALANRLNKGKSYVVPIQQNNADDLHNLENLLIDACHVKISNCVVNIIDGSLFKEYTDFNILCMSMHLTIRRYFNSNTKNDSVGLLGRGWVLEYETYCKYDNTQLDIIYADGTRVAFSKQDDNWVNSDNSSLTTVTNEDSRRKEITIKRANIFYVYSYDGRLKFIKDKNRNYFELRYANGSNFINKIVTSCGRSLDFIYKDNKIVQIIDNIGRSVQYFYKNDFLTLVEHTNGGKYKFSYDKVHNKLNEAIDANGNIEFQAEFERYGKPITLYYSKKLTLAINYDERNRRTTLGYNNFYLVFKYDRAGLVKEIKSSNGDILKFEYDDNGNEIKRTIINKGNPEETEISFKYNEYNQIIEEYLPDGFCTHWHYNNDNLISKINKSNDYEKIFNYDKIGNLIEIKEKIYIGVVAVTKYEFDEKGRLIEKIDSNKNVIKYEYKTDFSILPEITTYPNGYKLERQYDEVGRLIRELDLDCEIKFKYNNDDLLIQTIFSNGCCDYRRYDQMGNLKEVVLPRELKLSNEENRLAKKFSYIYDERNILVKIICPTGKILNPCELSKKIEDNNNYLYQYDFLGNVLKKRVPVLKNEQGEQLYSVTAYLYDKNLNIIQEKTASEYVTLTGYPSTYSIKYFEYDNRNNVKRIHANYSDDKKYFYKGIHRLTKEIIRTNDNKMHETLYEYNKMGLLSEKIELASSGEVAVKTKDGFNGRIKTRFEYDENSNLTKIILHSGEELIINYDDNGNIME